MRDALTIKFTTTTVAFQGVSAKDYPADLDGYIEEGGSNSCAVSLAAAVTNYATRCPSSKIVISGWSQGALCAHKSFDPTGPLNDPIIRNKVIALTTFGDPIHVWESSFDYPPLPSNTELLSYCQHTTPDPLCTDALQDFPHEPKAFIERLKAIWSDFSTADLNDQQKAAIADIAVTLPKQASKKIKKLGKDIISGHLDHWLLTPQHFLYGVGPNPMVVAAANDIYAVYQRRNDTTRSD